MAFGDSILSRFDPDPIEMMDPAYEGLGDVDDIDDAAYDFIDNIVYGGAFESVMTVDDELEEDLEDDEIIGDYDDDESFTEPLDDEELEELDAEECGISANEAAMIGMLNPEACCAAFEATVKSKKKGRKNNYFASLTPVQKRQMFVKMIMNNKKLSAADKKARIAKYDASHPATEALSAIMPRDDSTINDAEDILADIIDSAMNATDFPDPDMSNRASHSARLISGTQRKSDIDRIIDDLVFSGDRQANHSANLKTSYARESAYDDDFFTL